MLGGVLGESSTRQADNRFHSLYLYVQLEIMYIYSKYLHKVCISLLNNPETKTFGGSLELFWPRFRMGTSSGTRYNRLYS